MPSPYVPSASGAFSLYAVGFKCTFSSTMPSFRVLSHTTVNHDEPTSDGPLPSVSLFFTNFVLIKIHAILQQNQSISGSSITLKPYTPANHGQAVNNSRVSRLYKTQEEIFKACKTNTDVWFAEAIFPPDFLDPLAAPDCVNSVFHLRFTYFTDGIIGDFPLEQIQFGRQRFIAGPPNKVYNFTRNI